MGISGIRELHENVRSAQRIGIQVFNLSKVRAFPRVANTLKRKDTMLGVGELG